LRPSRRQEGSVGANTIRCLVIGIQGGKPMTFEQCRSALVAIRRKQGTRCPLIRVDYAGTVVRGRLARADTDPEHREAGASPYGVLVVENLGLSRMPEAILQIASIPTDGITSLEE
jgi:hypothetical protein